MIRAAFLATALIGAAESAVPPDLPEGLATAVKALHDNLTAKDVAGRYTRTDIEPFFRGRRDLDNFIVSLFSYMDEADFSDRQVDGWSIRSAHLHDEGARADLVLTIEGPWFLFLDTELEFEEQWVRQETGWVLVHPILENLPVK